MVAVCIAIFGKQRLNSPKRLCRSCGWNVTILPRIEIYAFGYFKVSGRRAHIQLARIFHPFLNRRHCGLEAAKFTSDRGFDGFLRGFRRIWEDYPQPPSAFERRGTRD